MKDLAMAILWLAALGVLVLFGGRIFNRAQNAASKSVLRNL